MNFELYEIRNGVLKESCIDKDNVNGVRVKVLNFFVKLNELVFYVNEMNLV